MNDERGAPPQSDAGSASGFRVYDFTNPDRLSRHQLRVLESLHDEAARGMLQVLLERAVENAEVRRDSISQLRVENFFAGLPQPALLVNLSLAPVSGSGVLQLEVALGFELINRLLGGRRTCEDPKRPLTEAEYAVLVELLSALTEAVSRAWEKLFPLRFEVTSAAETPSATHLGTDKEPLLAVRFQIRSGDRQGGLTLALPLTPLEAGNALEFEQRQVMAAEMPGSGADGGPNSALIATIPVRCRAQLAVITLTLRQLHSLLPGDVLVLRASSDESVALVSGDRHRISGRLTSEAGQLAIEVLAPDKAERGIRI